MGSKKGPRSFLKASELEAFHKRVCLVMLKAIGHQVEMKATIDGWKTLMASTDALIDFKMYPKLPQFQETAENDLGHRCPVLPFNNSANAFPTWIFCWDEWHKSGADYYDLVSFSLCFFGGEGRKKTQLLRAEWANPTKQGASAAQPHWHIDPNVMDVDFWNGNPLKIAIPANADTSLQELPVQREVESAAPAFWSLQKLHLGMGGWHHHADSPTCWQHPLDFSDEKEVLRWLSNTIVYVSNELGKAAVAN